MKRFLLLRMKGPLYCRLGTRVIDQIPSGLHNLKNKHFHSKFARKPRSLKKVEMWNATELRQFLLHTGIIVLRGVIHQNMY